MILHYNKRIEHFSILNVKKTQLWASNKQKNIISSKTNNKTVFNNIKDKNKEKLRSNAYVKIKDNINYYDDIYNYLYSKKRYMNESNKIDWKKVIYPAELNNINEKVKKDKKKQNFRELANKYVLDKDNVLFIKTL